MDLPAALRPLVLGTYAKIFGCNMQESLQTDFSDFRNLGEFFRRRLKDNVRPIDRNDQV